MARQRLLDDHHSQAGGSHVLLGPGVDQAVFGHVHRAGENVRGHIAHQGHIAHLGHILPLGAVNSVVGAVVEVAGRGVQLQLLLGGDIGVIPVGGVGGDVHSAVLLGLLHGQVGEVARHGVVGLPLLPHQIQGDGGELAGSAGLEEQRLIALWDVHDPAELLLSLGVDLHESLRSVTHLHH